MKFGLRHLLLPLAFVSAHAQADMEQKAILSLVEQEQAAWNRHDAAAFSARFTSDGSFANILGMSSYGREPFQRKHEHLFTTIYKDSQLVMTVDRVKLLRPEVALVSVNTVLSSYAALPPGITADGDGRLHTRLEMVLVKQADGWWIASFHNVAVASQPAH